MYRCASAGKNLMFEVLSESCLGLNRFGCLNSLGSWLHFFLHYIGNTLKLRVKIKQLQHFALMLKLSFIASLFFKIVSPSPLVHAFYLLYMPSDEIFCVRYGKFLASKE